MCKSELYRWTMVDLYTGMKGTLSCPGLQPAVMDYSGGSGISLSYIGDSFTAHHKVTFLLSAQRLGSQSYGACGTPCLTVMFIRMV